MPGRLSYMSRSNDPWFKVGSVDVNTTTLVTGLSVFSFFVYAAAKSSLANLALLPWEVKAGQLWRLASWPLVNPPDIWVALTLAIFWMFGNQLEDLMGRKKFLGFLGALTIVPGLLATALDVPMSGIQMVETGVFVAFAIEFPNAQFFFGIPARVMAAIFVGIEALRYLGDYRELFLVLVATIAVAALFLRSVGLARDLPWLPVLPIPGLGPSTARRKPGSATSPTKKKGRVAKARDLQKRENSALRIVENESMLPKLDDTERKKRIDAILDKISATGIESLTAEEREILQRGTK